MEKGIASDIMKRLVPLLVLTSVTSSLMPPSDPESLVLHGDVVIGVLADLHRKGASGGCGPIDVITVEEVAAAEWALATINNQSQHDYPIGLRVYDTCGNKDIALRQTIRLLQDVVPPNPPLLGVLALSSDSVAGTAVAPLHAFNTPVLVTQPNIAHTIKITDNVFSTAPHLTDLLQATLSAAVRDGGSHSGISVASTCDQAAKVLQEQAQQADLHINHVLRLSRDQHLLPDQLHNFVTRKMGYGGILILLLNTGELNTVSTDLSATFILRKNRLHLVVATLDANQGKHHALDIKKLQKNLPGSLLVQPHAPQVPGFKNYLADVLTRENATLLNPVKQEYLEDLTHCSTQALPLSSELHCSGVTASHLLPILSGSEATATVKAVSSLAAAFRLVQIEKCSRGEHCLQAIGENLHTDVLSALLKLSFTLDEGTDRIRYTADGRLVNTFTISFVTHEQVIQVGLYREDTGVVWSTGGAVEQRGRQGRMMGLVAPSITGHTTGVKAVLVNHKDYVGRTWAFSVLVVACLGVVFSLYIAVYVALRVCDGTLSGPQVLGAVLLLGVMGMFASCVVYVLPPSPLLCAVRQWSPPMCLALCYAILLVKAMHLRALVYVGERGLVSQVNLHISLLFMVGVQLVLCLLGHAGGFMEGEAPLVHLDVDGSRQCGQQRIQTLATRLYLLMLLLITWALGLANRKIHRNHNEGRWLLLTVCVSMPIVAAWSGISYLAPPQLEAPTTSVAILVLAMTMLGLIFVPKIRVISKQARDYKHKRMSAAASVSTVISQMDAKGQLRMTPDTLKKVYGESYSPNGAISTISPKLVLQSSDSGSVGSNNSSRHSFPRNLVPTHDPRVPLHDYAHHHHHHHPSQGHDSSFDSPRSNGLRNPIYHSENGGAYP